MATARSSSAVAFRRAQYALKRSVDRLTKRVKSLSSQLKTAREQLSSISDEALCDKLRDLDIPEAQATAIKECISAAKCTNKKNRRYTEQWLLLCLLLHIRSPSGYSFLRNNNILPLPCVSTIRKYLSMVRVKCGFDSRFFTTFKNKLASKDNFQKHGILIFDEIHVRKEMRVNVATMSYTGHADFGGEVEVSEQLADHGLVFTFRPFGENYSQPVAVFASHGPTKGTVLAQLIVKAILLLEDAGAYVDAIVCDGAATNRSMWTQFGVTGALHGAQNSF